MITEAHMQLFSFIAFAGIALGSLAVIGIIIFALDHPKRMRRFKAMHHLNDEQNK